jgi:ribonuclease P protein component
LPGDEPRDEPRSARRLRGRNAVRRVLAEGRALGSSRVVVYLAPGTGPSRAAWVAGRRAGGAVTRNRMRRLLREAWWALASHVEDGHELVLVARGPFRGAKAPDLTEEIEGVLIRAGAMRR